jgi:hypothetical protein
MAAAEGGLDTAHGDGREGHVLHPHHARQQLLLQRRIFEDAEGDHQQVPLPADGHRR